MAKKDAKTNSMVSTKSTVIDNVDALLNKMNEMKEAQRIFSTYTQEQVDKIFLAASIAANKQRISLAKMAVEETGMGIVEDKVMKTLCSEYIQCIQEYQNLWCY